MEPLDALVVFWAAEREVDFALKLTDLNDPNAKNWRAYVFALRELTRLYLASVGTEPPV